MQRCERPSRIGAALLCALGVGATACGHSTSVTLRGDREPKTKVCTLGERAEIDNGDFRIVQKCVSERNLTVGDGLMEMTTFEFPIADRFANALRQEECIIVSATVEMELAPKEDPYDESLSVPGKWQFGLEEVRGLDPDAGFQTVEIDMMERPGGRSPYDSRTLREIILQGPTSRIPVEYGYEAVISKATLDLSCE